MSANGDGDEEIPGREIAYRLFAAEYDDASLSYAESDEERAPNYVITPTGARLNRLFAVGTLTEVTAVNDEMLRARVVDPTGAFVVYAGQYQPDELAALEQLEPPVFVAVTGKARTYQPDDSDRVYTSIRPESIAPVDADTRDRWVVSAAEQTLDRIGTYAGVAERDASDDALTAALREAGVDRGLASGIPLARDHYGTTADYLAALRDCAIEAVEVVAGDREQVSGLTLNPDASSPEIGGTFGDLATLADVDAADVEAIDDSAAESKGDAADESDAEEPEAEPVAATASGSAAGTASAAPESTGSDGESESESAIDAAAETGESAETDDLGDFDGDSSGSDDGAIDETDAETGDVDADAADEADAVDSTDGDIGDFDGGMYEMDEEEREQIEEEYGTEFTTGADVDEPGESEIDTSSPAEEPADDGSESAASASESDADDLGAPPESSLDGEPTDAEADAETTADEEDVADDELEDPEAESAPEIDGEESTGADEDEVDEDETDADEDAPAAEDVDLESFVVETMEELDDGSGADRAELVEAVAADTGASEGEVEDAIQDALMGGQCYEPDDGTLKAI
ncbi:hypothetical protein [Halosolutus gelatinilyticus]|uniref:hypothetical protein n=1 Tax=Halosolutus gelatinilyticus TaxID=2931975 RepID=UPI001FF47F08|nr:hypothetical protein [Halosolutus gelatinilyticus]